MIVFLYGEDSYRAWRKMNEIVESYKKIHKSGLNLRYFEGKDFNFSNFRDEIQQTSMFKEKKLAVLKNVFSNAGFKEGFLKESKRFVDSEDVILFYQKGKVDQRDSLFKFLKKKAKCQEFSSLGGQRLKEWIKREAESYQTEIEPAAQNLLIDYVGNNLWQMTNEIRKLVSFKRNKPVENGHDRGYFQHLIKIKAEDVKLLVRPKIETDIFKTIEAIAAKNKKQALGLLHQHLQKGDSPLYLLSMINYQFRNILMVKWQSNSGENSGNYLSLSRKLGMHPFVVQKSLGQAEKFTLEELKKIYQKIFEADLNIKTGKVEPETALDMFIAEI